ncbi:MAG: SDR family NAD(P)-dependent oxidoreductase [Bacteroidales bacterium]|jgi:NAD(P)-dependent dehydrogenase (short-subunit alcohol dehydrogenase family)|nr:SDR family NAD(P)-dependent oxidoreductase [Bacteroidales bacterium]
MEKWSYDSIPDQNNRIVFITGANSGLGFQTSLMLAKKGAEIIMACRNHNKALTAADDIRNVCPNAKLFTLKLDLSDLNSVVECAEKINAKYSHLDLIINNAGVMVPPFSRTKQGFELQFGTNHLAHFALTAQLFPLIKNVENSRIVSVSSIAATMNYIDFNDLNYEHKKYRKWKAYSQSKLANLMFMRELADKLKESGCKTISVAAHPGISSTNLFKTAGFFGRKNILSIISQSPEAGALSVLRAACDSDVENGSYWGPSGVFGMKGAPSKAKIVSKALNRNLTEKLWDISEKLTGVKYEF